MPVPWKTGGRIQPHRERAKAAKVAAVQALNAALEPLQIEPPEWLTDAAQDAWRELRPLLPEEVVRQSDLHLVAMTCTLQGKLRRDELNSGGMNTLLSCLDKLCITPAGRRKLASMRPAGAGDTASNRFARFACLDVPDLEMER